MAKIIEKKLVSEFIGNSEEYISIPIYQRNYDWETTDISKLIDDVLDFYEVYKDDVAENYYLGNLITREVETESGDINMILIDGQQRVTTTLLILLALRNNELVEEPREISKLIKTLAVGNKIKLNRVNDEDVVRKLIENNLRALKEADEQTRMYSNYKFVSEYIKKQKIDANVLLAALNRVVIVDVKVPKRNETKVFETINSTGKKLKPADLIKAFILFNSYTFTEQEANDIEYKFEKSITDKFFDIKELSDFYRYYIAIVGEKPLVKRGSLSIFNQFKRLHSDYLYEELSEVEKMIDDIGYHASIFNTIHNFEYKEPVNKLYKKVYDNNDKTYYPLAHYMMMKYVTDFKDEEQLSKVMKLLAKISLFRVMGSYPDKNITQSIVTMFPDFIKYRGDESTTIEDFEDFIETISASKNYGIPTKDVIDRDIIKESHYSNNLAKTRTVLLAAEVFSNKGNAGTHVDIQQKFDLEHVFPQTDTKWAEVKSLEEIRELTFVRDNIGNLTLLAKKLNIQASNSYFDVKKDFILKDTLRLSSYFMGIEDWNPKEINKRALNIASTIYDHFNKNRDTKYTSEVIKLESVVETNTRVVSFVKVTPKGKEYLEFFEEIKSKIGDLSNQGVSIRTPRPQSWLTGGLRLAGVSREISIYIQGIGKNKIATLSYDGDAEWKSKNIDKFERESEIKKMFTGDFNFRPIDKKTFGFRITLGTYNIKNATEVANNFKIAINEVIEKVDSIFDK